jgi:hypothetical protein
MKPTTATITALHIYPVKSCRGISLAGAELTGRGLAHDREWMLVDAAGQFLTQRALPRMALIETALTSDTLRLTLPGQSEALELPLAERDLPRCRVRVWRDDCDAFDEGAAAAGRLSAFLGKDVRLVRFDSAHKRHSNFQWTRGMVAENRFSDGFPVLVLSEESLEALNHRLDVPLPMNRFRPNIVMRGLGPHGEDDARVLGGDGFEIHLVKPCVRCSVTATDQMTTAVGKEPLRTLATYRRDEALDGITFGMNGIVIAHAHSMLAVGTCLTVGMTARTQIESPSP